VKHLAHQCLTAYTNSNKYLKAVIRKRCLLDSGGLPEISLIPPPHPQWRVEPQGFTGAMVDSAE